MKQNCLWAVELVELKKPKQTRLRLFGWIVSQAIQPWIIFFPLNGLTVFGLLLKLELFFVVDSSTIELAFAHLQPVLLKQALIIEYISFSSIPYFSFKIIKDYVKDRGLSLLRTLIISTSTFVMLCIIQFVNLVLLS